MISFFNSLGRSFSSDQTPSNPCVEGTGIYIPTLFIGQSNMVVRSFPNSVIVPSGVAQAWNGNRVSGEVVDWPLTDSPGYIVHDEGTMLTNFAKRFFEVTGDKLSAVKYAMGSTRYGDWDIEPYNLSGNHWGSVITGSQFPVYQSCLDTAALYLTDKGLTNADLKHIVMYLGESDAMAINNQDKKDKSLADLYDLVDRFHVEFPNAIFNIVETSYPANQEGFGVVAVRDNQRTVAANRNFVRIIDNLTYTIPEEQTEDGLHLLPVANNAIAERVVNNIKMLDYCG